MAEEQQDVETLKRRGRRRLVGAVALVLLAVIVLPMVFDPEPKSTLAPVSVRIPGENETPFTPKPVAKPAPKAEPALEAPKPAAEAPKPATEAPKTAAEAPKPAVEAAKPPSAAPKDEYVIQVGAFAKPEPVIAKLATAKLPYYTEPVQGNLTRVRAGPFATREAAERAVAKLKELGLKPGAVAAKGG